jgi:hypothetical protein
MINYIGQLGNKVEILISLPWFAINSLKTNMKNVPTLAKDKRGEWAGKSA